MRVAIIFDFGLFKLQSQKRTPERSWPRTREEGSEASLRDMTTASTSSLALTVFAAVPAASPASLIVILIDGKSATSPTAVYRPSHCFHSLPSQLHVLFLPPVPVPPASMPLVAVPPHPLPGN